MSVSIDVSYGELIDKITILEIKAARMDDAAKLRNVQTELQLLAAERAAHVQPSAAVEELTRQLHTVNSFLWEVEDKLREKERHKHFDAEFIELARDVYRTNDRRAELKRKLNELLGSRIVEEKAYRPY
jgi:hypothetical protein